MEDFAQDPVIELYLKTAKSTEHETELPVYSETVLRLAFRQIFRKRPVEPFAVTLYRQLLLFHYHRTYEEVSDLLAIMTCFNEDQLYDAFERADEIIEQWHEFTAEHLATVVFKQAYAEILYEWTRRYQRLYGDLDATTLHEKAAELKVFLSGNERCVRQWMKGYYHLMESRRPLDVEAPISDADLVLSNVFEAVKPRLNQYVISNCVQLNYEEPVKKRAKIVPNKTVAPSVTLTPSSPLTSTSPSLSLSPEAGCSVVIRRLPVTPQSVQIIENQQEYSNWPDEDGMYEDGIYENANFIKQEVSDDDADIAAEGETDSNGQEYTLLEIEEVPAQPSCAQPPLLENQTNDKSKIINFDQAISYLSALQAYAIVNGHLEEIVLLDEVDTAFRKKHDESILSSHRHRKRSSQN